MARNRFMTSPAVNIGRLMARLGHMRVFISRPMSMLFLSDLPKSNQSRGTDFWKKIVSVTRFTPSSSVFTKLGRL